MIPTFRSDSAAIAAAGVALLFCRCLGMGHVEVVILVSAADSRPAPELPAHPFFWVHVYRAIYYSDGENDVAVLSCDG